MFTVCHYEFLPVSPMYLNRQLLHGISYTTPQIFSSETLKNKEAIRISRSPHAMNRDRVCVCGGGGGVVGGGGCVCWEMGGGGGAV